MGLTGDALAQTREAFDGVAATYGEANDRNPVITWMRARAMAWLLDGLPPDARVLDLGCGPGPDSMLLAARGCRVTALEWSTAMAEVARRTAAARGLADRVDVHTVGLHEVDAWPDGRWDAALSNLGPLNCVPDLDRVAAALFDRLTPDGRIVVSVIGRVCPWEWVVFGLRRDWARARVRWARGFVPVPLQGRTVWMRYLSPALTARTFRRAGFNVTRQRGLGLFAPPPYLEAFCGRHPRLTSALVRADDLAGGWPILRHAGDHFLLEARRP